MVLGTQKTFNLPDGREVVIETGKIAKQADGSAVVRCGDTVLLATVCSKTEVGEDVDFMPLTVDYQEKYYSVGRFPGGFFKREARLSEYEILISRLIDRALRPLFPDNYHADTQVLVYLISGDKENLPDAFAALAASTALTTSDIPCGPRGRPVRNQSFGFADGKSRLGIDGRCHDQRYFDGGRRDEGSERGSDGGSPQGRS